MSIQLHRVRLAAISLLLFFAVNLGLLSPAVSKSRTPPPPPTAKSFVSHDAINQLASALSYYQRVAQSGGWPALPKRTVLRSGDSDAEVLTLRRRLKISGDMPANIPDSYSFDADVKRAVIAYQDRNGLEPTGVVYGITLRSLNASVDYRIKQLQVNLSRMQQLLPKLNSERYLLMNAASFEVQGIRNGNVEIASRSIVGKRATPTPTVSASIRAVNLLPYWHVPSTIARRALIPAIQKDPTYLYREKIRVFSSFGGEEVDPSQVNWWGPESQRYVFRQDPGQQNALGVVRLDMPNKHIVYMHDTPMKQLFNRHERAYSAGCVRVQTVLDVAAWLIDGKDGWTRQRIDKAIAAGSRDTIKLPQPVPVHFIYLTAWVENATVQFRNDLYNRDDSYGAEPEGKLAGGFQTTITP